MVSIDSKILETTKAILKEFGNTYFSENGALKRNKVIEDLDAYKPVLMQALFANDLIHDTYTEVLDVNGESIEVFKLNQFIEMFTYKEYWQDSYTKFENKIGLTAGNKFIDESADVVLDFPFKDTVLKAGMTKEDEKGTDEPFLHETIAKAEIDQLLEPKIFVNATKYDEQHIDGAETSEFDENDNLIIKGNNLIALHSLKERYSGKVKLIYLDPPFNTMNDSFLYNDNFNHSAWLTFMYNRLQIAKELLSQDGFIFIELDYNEDAYLKVLMDSIFGRDNYVTTITVKSNTISGLKTAHKGRTLLKSKDSILFYKKENIELKPQYAVRKQWDTHFNSFLYCEGNQWFVKPLKDVLIENNIINDKQTVKPYMLEDKKFKDFVMKNANWIVQSKTFDVKDLKVTSLENPGKIFVQEKEDGTKIFAKDGRRLVPLSQSFNMVNGKKELSNLLGDLWTDIDFSNTQNQGGVDFTNAKKPERLVSRIIDMGSNENDLVLDFFMGSATSQAVAMKMNRRFIGIEQMDYIKSVSVERLKKVIEGEQGGISKDVNWQGGGSFVYAELMEKNQGYLKEVQHAGTSEQLEAVINKMVEGAADFDFRVDIDKVLQDPEYQTMSLDDKKRLIIKIIDKNQLYYAYSDLDDSDVQELLSGSDIAFNKSFYEERDF